MKVKGPRALVKRLDAQAMKSSLIEVIQYNAPPSQFAFVLVAGDGVRLPNGGRRPLEFKSGDTVITKPHCGAPVEVAGEECFMVMEDDVLAIVTK